METFWRDLRHSIRLFVRAPGFTAVALAALAVGIGANTAIFSVVNAVLLRPLPFPDPDRLIYFMNTSPQGSGPGASPTKFNTWRAQTAVFEDAAAYRFGVVNLTGGDDPEQVPSGQVSVDFFRLFGTPVLQGRTFTAEEDRPNGDHVAVLSYGFWQRRFGGQPMIGHTISVAGDTDLVVGILGPSWGASQFDPFPDIWTPFQIDPGSTDRANYFTVAARLKPGITLGMAKARMPLVATEYRQRFPDDLGPQSGFGAELMQEIAVRGVRPMLLVLVGAVSFVLLIACANVANLLLVRATARRREMAIRAAMGAGRGRILRQLLTESVVLSLAGGALGLVLGVVGIRALLAANPGNIPRIHADGSGVTADWRVVAFTVAVSLLTGVLFGLFPALQSSRADLSLTLKESGGRAGTSIRQNKARSLLVVVEVGLALVLLVGSALLIRTFIALRSVDPGYATHNILTFRMSLNLPRFTTTTAIGQLARDGQTRLRAIPGVEAASSTCCIPLEGGYGLPFIIVGRPLTGPSHGGGGWQTVSPGFFEVFKIPVLRGRVFTDRDDTGAPGVVVINQSMARRYWPNGDPLADRLIIGKGVGPEFEEPPRQIIGIIGDVRDGGLNRDPQPTMYVPYAQVVDAVNALNVRLTPMAWLVRTRGEPHAVSAAAAKELREASGGLPVARVRSMDEVVVQSTAQQDFNMLLLTVFAVSALLLAAIGVYGVMAYSVQQRTQEIGIRRALGAPSSHVRNMIVAQGMQLALAGVVAGLLSAVALSRVMASLLFGVTARDPFVFAGVASLLSLVALVSVWLPALRAARVDPIVALRFD